MILRSLCLAGVVAVLLSGCGGGGTVKSCPAPETSCDGFCAKLDSDTAHCGACGNHCAAQQTCNSGVCTNCPTGELPCSGACIDVQNDRNNCGGCGIACGANESCDRGACVATGLTNCGVSNGTVSAKDLNADPENCGRCGNACPANHLCTAGVCTPSCTGTGRLCEADPSGTGAPTLICIDTATNPDHCGGCSVRCGPNQTCTLGTCTNCPAGQLQCAGATAGTTACRPVLSDNDNCGGCGIACGQGSSCDNGVCVSANLTNCGGLSDGGVAVFDLQNDLQNCGACGNACVAREVCRAGNCTACPIQSCGNRCIDTTSDPNNCGGCGTACAGTMACIDGACAAPISIKLQAPTIGGGVAASSSYSAVIEVTSLYPVSYASVDVAGVGPTQLTAGASAYRNGYYVSGFYAVLTSGTAGTSQSLTFVVRDSLYLADAGTSSVHEAQLATSVLARALPSTAPTLALAQADGGALPSGSYLGLNGPQVTLVATTTDPNTTDVEFRAGGYPVITAKVSGSTAQASVAAAALTSDNQQIVACATNAAGTGPCSTAAVLNVGNPPANLPLNAHAVTIDPQTKTVTAWFLSGGSVIAFPTDYVGSALPAPLAGAPTSVLQIVSPDSSTLFALRADGVWSIVCSGGSCASTQVVNSGSMSLTGFRSVNTKALVLDTQIGLAVGAALGQTLPASVFAVGYPSYQGGWTRSGAIAITTKAAATSGPYKVTLIHPALTGGQQVLVSAANTLDRLEVMPTGEMVWQFGDNAGNHYAQAASFDGATVKTTPQLAVGANTMGPPLLSRPGQLLTTASIPNNSNNELVLFDVTSQTATVPAPPAVSGGSGYVLYNVRGRYGPGQTFAVSDDQQKAVFVTDAGSGLSTVWLVDLTTGSATALHTGMLSAGGPTFVHTPAGLNVDTTTTPSGQITNVPVLYWAETVPNSNPPTAQLYYQRYGAGPAPVGSPVLVDAPALVGKGPLDEVFASGTSGQLFFQTPSGGRMDLAAVQLNGSSTSVRIAQDVTGFIGREKGGFLVVGQNDGALRLGRLSSTAPLSSGLLSTVAWNLSALPIRGAANQGAPPFGVLMGQTVFAITGGSYLNLTNGAVGTLLLIDPQTGAARNGGEVAYNLGGSFAPGLVGEHLVSTDHSGTTYASFDTDLATGTRQQLGTGATSCRQSTAPMMMQDCAAGSTYILRSNGVGEKINGFAPLRGQGLDFNGGTLDFLIGTASSPAPALFYLSYQTTQPVQLIAGNLTYPLVDLPDSRRSSDNTVLGFEFFEQNTNTRYVTRLPLSGNPLPEQLIP